MVVYKFGFQGQDFGPDTNSSWSLLTINISLKQKDRSYCVFNYKVTYFKQIKKIHDHNKIFEQIYQLSKVLRRKTHISQNA